MGLITGASASINGLTCLERFKIVTTGMDNAVACSATGGAVVRGNTNKDWYGVAVGYGHTPPKLPGDLFTFVGSPSAGRVGWTSAANGAIVTKVSIFAQPQESKLFYYHLHFAGNGSLTATGTAAADTTTPKPVSSWGCGIRTYAADADMSDPGNATVLSGILGWQLDLECNVADPIWQASDSGWPRRASDGATNATVGNFDATIKYRQAIGSSTEVAAYQTFLNYELTFDDDTLDDDADSFWRLSRCAIFENPIDVVIRNAQNKPEFVATEYTAKWSAYYIETAGDTSYTKGLIAAPGTTTFTGGQSGVWWPKSA